MWSACNLPPSQPPGSLRAQGHCGSKDSCILQQASALEPESVPAQGSERISLPASHPPHQESTSLQWIPGNGKKNLTGKKALKLHLSATSMQDPKQLTSLHSAQRKAQTMQSAARINREILSEKNQTKRQNYCVVFENI